jgi:hypothetical protein
MVTSVHPAYDPNARIWFTDDGVVAKSLAELTRKLPGVKIEGYCPNGYGSIVRPRAPEVAKITLNEALKMRTPVLRQPVQTVKEIPKEIRQKPAAAEEKVESLSVKVVAVKEDVAPKKRVLRPRRPSLFPDVDWQLPANQERLRGLVEKGLSSKQIGERWPVSRNAIIGACARLGYTLKQKRGTESKPKSSWGGPDQ